MKTTGLPAFDNPPVVEVASSIQFGAVQGLDGTRLGLLWSSYRKDYPRTELYPSLPHEVENFGPPSMVGMPFNVTSMIAPRYWFLNEKGTRLVQVQQDRFVLNWRKLDRADEKYLHYSESLRPLLVEEYGRFERFLNQEGLPVPIPDQAELTYVNHIPARSANDARETAARFTRLWSGEPRDTLLGAAEELHFGARYVMRNDASEPVGRLYISLQSHYRVSDGSPLYVFQLVARGAPEGKGLNGALAFLDRAHAWIVQTFADITTPEMHQVWKRTR